MIRSPLFAGEIIHLSRTPRTWAIRTGLAVFLAAAAAMAWPWSGSALKMHDAGAAMFQLFFWTEFVAGVLLVPAMVAPSIAWERENGTLDLLSVAPVTDFEIVSGKLFANGALVAATLGAGLPFGIAALMLGGATPEMLLATTVGLVLHGIFAASISILMSASSDRAGVATGLAIVTLVVFGVISLTLGWVGSLIAEGLLVGRTAGAASSFREGIPPVLFSVLCPWSSTVRDAVGGGISGASWLQRSVAWTIHLLESGGALALAGIVLRHKRSPGSRGAALVPLTGPGPRIPMAVLAPPVAQAKVVPSAARGIPFATLPVAMALPALPAFAAQRYRNLRLPVRGNPIYWKDRIFDDSPARQVLVVLGAAACGIVFFGDAVAWLFICVIGGRPLSAFAPSHLTLVFDLAVTLVLAVGAGAATLGPERQQGTLPILLATGMPSRDILRGKFLAAIRSIAPVLVVAGAHLAFASLTMGVAGLPAALAFILGLASAFALACSLSLAAGHPRRAAVLTTGALFALWAVPSLFALPFPAHADFLTSLNPFGLLIRSVSLAGGHSAEPHTAGAVLFVLGSAAISIAALAAASAALESRVRA